MFGIYKIKFFFVYYSYSDLKKMLQWTTLTKNPSYTTVEKDRQFMLVLYSYRPTKYIYLVLITGPEHVLQAQAIMAHLLQNNEYNDMLTK